MTGEEKVDEQIRNSLVCQFNYDGCDKRVLGVVNAKWSCGRCMLKIEEKMKLVQQKLWELTEKEIESEKEDGRNL